MRHAVFPTIRILGAALLVGCGSGATPTPIPGLAPIIIERVSVAANGSQWNHGSTHAAISADGRFVTFTSHISNLVPGATDPRSDVFVHDRETGQNTLASGTPGGAEGFLGLGFLGSEFSVISADGRFVAFRSRATNLVPGDTNREMDVFLHDRESGTTVRVSVSSEQVEGNGYSDSAAISPDGRFVGFRSGASNLVPGDTNGQDDVFLYDRETGVTVRINVAEDGSQADLGSSSLVIATEGRLVVFQTWSAKLVAGAPFGASGLVVRDLQAGLVVLVSVATDGTSGNDGNSYVGAITPGGRFIAFESEASNLVVGDTNAERDVFVHDRESGETERVSVATDGTEGNDASWAASMSADGRYVAFHSRASNLVHGDSNRDGDDPLKDRDVFVHDRHRGITVLVSVDREGNQADGWSNAPSISADGRFIAFDSVATNMVPGDTNGTNDVFVATNPLYEERK